VVHDRQRVGGVNVQHEGGQQADPHHPQHDTVGHDREKELSQRLTVEVDLVGAFGG